MRGRKPKPTKIRLLQGRAGHRPINKAEPRPEPKTPPFPEGLSAGAREEWEYITTELQPLGILVRADKAILAGYCQAYADWLDCVRFLIENGNVVMLRNDKGEVRWIQEAPQARLALKYQEKVRQFGAELGLSPSSRTRIHAQPQEEKNTVEDFLYGKK